MFCNQKKNTEATHPDYEHLTKATNELQKVAIYINENKRKVENMNKVLHIQECMEGYKVTEKKNKIGES